MAFGNMGTIWSEIGLNTAKLQAGAATAKMQLSALDRTAMTQAASINAKLMTIGTGLQSVGKKMSMFVTLPILAVGAAATKAGSDFESGMTKSLAIMDSVSPKIRKQMELTAKDVVKYTTFSAKEAADAYFYLASAGLDAAQSIEALPRVAKFAQAGQFDLALATDLLTDAQSALGLTIRDDVIKNMENMTRVSDVLVKANTLSNATVQQFSESLTNKAGAAMKLLNKDIEEGVAVLAAWADQGVKGTEAGNYLNIVLRDLQTASIKNEETFEQFGINVYDTAGNMRNMADVVGDLEVALDGMSDKEKRATLMMLGFQDRSISAMMTLLGTSDAIRDYEKDLRSAAGYTADVAAKQMESFAASVEQLKNELINIGIEIFEILKPRLESLVESIKKGIEWFDSLTESQKKWIVNLSLVAAAIGPVLFGLGSLIRTYGTLRTAVVTANIAMHGSLGALSGIAAMGAILALYAKDMYSASEATEEYTKKIKEREQAEKDLINTEVNLRLAREENIPSMRSATDAEVSQFKAIEQTDDALVDYNARMKERDNLILEGVEHIETALEAEERHKYFIDLIRISMEAEGASAIEVNRAIREQIVETDDLTESNEEAVKSIDDLTNEFNELINTIFGHITTYNDFQEAGWAVEEAEKALAAAIKEHGEESREAEQSQNNLDAAMITSIQTAFELSNEIGATTEQQEEARKKAVELGLEYVNTEQIGAKAFLDMAKAFGMSAADIIDFADKMGIEIDYVTRARLVVVEFNEQHVNDATKRIQQAIDELHGKTVTLETIYKTSRILGAGLAMGGIVGYANGGVVGNDGYSQPMLTAASGIITPQTGRAIPIMAHENEIIANTSQQKNLAEWIMGKANTKPDGNGGGQEVTLHIPLSVDGRVLYDVWEKYDLMEQARRI